MVDIGGRPLLLLLRLVTAGGAAVSATRLRADIWGGDSSGDGVVRVNLTRLRRALGDAAVERRDGGYTLSGVQVDADRFDVLVARGRDRSTSIERRIAAYDEALTPWRGPAFEGFDGIPWLQAAAARLDELREVAVDERFELRSLVEDPARLVPDLTIALEHGPVREHRVELLATALYRSQRQSEAIDVIRGAATTLRDELGLEPGPSLRELEHRILVHDPSLLVTPRTIRSTTAPDVEGQLRAATALVRSGAHAEAIAILDRVEAMAREAGDRRSTTECLIVRAVHHSMSGSGDPRATLDAARRIARDLRDGPLLARIAITSFGHGATTDLGAGLVELLEPLELLPTTAPERVDLLCAAAVMASLTSGSTAGELLLAGASEVHDAQANERTAAVLAAARCIVSAGLGSDAALVEAQATESLRFAQQTDDPVLAVVAAHALMRAHYVRGEIDEVDRLLGPLLAAGRAAMLPFAIARVGLCEVIHAIVRGQFDVAVDRIEQTARTGERLRTLNTERALSAQRALMLLELDRLHEVRDELEPLAEPGADHAHTFGALIGLIDGTPETVLELAGDVPGDATRPPFVALAAITAAEHDDRELAAWCLPHLAAAGDVVIVAGLGTLLFGFAPHFRATVRAVLADLDGAVADYERATELSERVGAALWLDHARVGLARVLVQRARGDDRRRADELLAAVRSGAVVAVSPRLARAVAAVEALGADDQGARRQTSA